MGFAKQMMMQEEEDRVCGYSLPESGEAYTTIGRRYRRSSFKGVEIGTLCCANCKNKNIDGSE